MLTYLTHSALKDICLRLVYYPDYFTVAFFCNNEKENIEFISTIKEIINKYKNIENIEYTKNCIKNNKVLFKFYTISEVNTSRFLGARANIGIISSKYTYETIQEVILPMINLTPQESYIYFNSDIEHKFDNFLIEV